MTGTVSPATQQRLLEAMQRLFAGTPQHTDGRLTKNNLCREAQVSRATMNRAGDILAAWDAQVKDSPAGTAVRCRDYDLSRLEQDLKASRARCHELQDHLDAAATALRRQAADTTSPTLIPLRRRQYEET
jgi:hypothetical protein